MKLGSKALAIVLLFLGLVLVNYLASQLPVRGDATAEKIYTLSPGTKALLAKIEEPITLDFYFSKDAAGLPVAYKNYAARVQEMLRHYARASGGKLTLNVIHPRPDTPEEERATAAGLTPQATQGGTDQVFFGLVATQADQQKTLAVFNPQRESFLEYDLSQLVYSVQQFDKKKLGLITSLPLKAPPYNPMMMMQQRQQPPSDQFVLDEWERTFAILSVESTATELPANLDALAIIHPQNLSPKLQYAIDQFLLSGKPVFVAVDPSSQHFRRQGGQAAMFGGPTPNVSSDLPTLFNAWGIAYDPGIVIGDLNNATQVQTNAGVVRYPVWLTLQKQELDAQATPTAQLSSLLFIESGSLAFKPDTGLTVTRLIQTSDQSGDVNPETLQFAQPEAVARQIVPSGKKILAAMVSGTFKTAFPGGAPTDAPAAPGTAPAPTPTPAPTAAPSLKEGKSTLIVVADTDWLMDDYSVRRFSYFGQQAAEPINDNLAFGTNAVEFLAGSQDLLSIRGKGNSLRPFTVVRAMEVEAQKRYQSKLAELETRLTDVQQKLTELQGKRTEGNRLVATPEMKKAIEDFQKQEASMRRERREIRRALREDIDALENRLLLVNLLATPLLVGVFGLWFARARRQ